MAAAVKRAASNDRFKVRVDVQYLGTRYCGWQPQADQLHPAVYRVLSAALNNVDPDFGGPVVAGRTDKGVHAAHQVCSVRAPRWAWKDPRSLRTAELLPALNRALPDDVRVLRLTRVPKDFHAMTSARWKRYAYYVAVPKSGTEGRCEAPLTSVGEQSAPGVDNHLLLEPLSPPPPPPPPPAWTQAVWRREGALDVNAVQRAAAVLVGTHDFRHLTSDRRKLDTRRTISAVSVEDVPTWNFPFVGRVSARASAAGTADVGRLVRFAFEGDGFLKHQVRRMVGLLVLVASERLPEDAVRQALGEQRPPWVSGQSGVVDLIAPPQGLWLEHVEVEMRGEEDPEDEWLS